MYQAIFAQMQAAEASLNAAKLLMREALAEKIGSEKSQQTVDTVDTFGKHQQEVNGRDMRPMTRDMIEELQRRSAARGAPAESEKVKEE